MLSGPEIAAMRATAEQAMPSTAEVLREQRVGDGGGGFTQQWQPLGPEIPARIAPLGGGEDGSPGSRVSQETTHVVTLPADSDVTEADRLRVDGQVYEITIVRQRGQWELTRRLEVREAS